MFVVFLNFVCIELNELVFICEELFWRLSSSFKYEDNYIAQVRRFTITLVNLELSYASYLQEPARRKHNWKETAFPKVHISLAFDSKFTRTQEHPINFHISTVGSRSIPCRK